jgi:hypothetical protein
MWNFSASCELRDEIAEHMRRTGEAVQQYDGWRSLRTCFAIEELESVDGGVLKHCHDDFPWSGVPLLLTGSEITEHR